MTPVLITVFSGISLVFEMLGRDLTLTGRVFIWPAVVEVWLSAPILGYGWGAVWSDDSFVASEIARTLGFTVHHSHNGFLDLLIRVGPVGLWLVLAAVGLVFRGSLVGAFREESASSRRVAGIAVVLVLLVYLIVESRVWDCLWPSFDDRI